MKIYPLLVLIVGCSITSGVIGTNVSELKNDKHEEGTASNDAITGTPKHQEAQENHKHISNAVNIRSNPESINDETRNEEGENANDYMNEISAYTNPRAEHAQTPGNQKPITVTQDIGIERDTGSSNSESNFEENNNGKSQNDASDGITEFTKTSDEDPVSQAKHTHITNAIDNRRGEESGNDGNEEETKVNGGNNEISAHTNPTPEDTGNQKTSTITQGRFTGIESTIDEKSPNDGNDGTFTHTDTTDAGALTPANHTHITLTQAIDIGGIAESIKNEPKDAQDEEAKDVNDDIQDASAHSDPNAEDGKNLGNLKPITITQDIDIERITGIAGSESPDDLDESRNDVKDGISTHSNTIEPSAQIPTNHTHITITNAVNIGSNRKSSSGESRIDENEGRKTESDEKYQSSAHISPTDRDKETAENQKPITQDIDIERIAGSTGSKSTIDEIKDEKTAYENSEDTSLHTDTTFADAQSPTVHSSITDGDNIRSNAKSRSGESGNDEWKNENDYKHESSAHSNLTDEGAIKLRNQKQITVPQDIDNEHITGSTDEEKTANGNKNEISPHPNPTAEDAKTPGSQTPITITQDIDIKRFTEIPISESIVDENINEKLLNNDGIYAQTDTTDADAANHANHTHITLTQAVKIGRNAENSSYENQNLENKDGKNKKALNEAITGTSRETNPESQANHSQITNAVSTGHKAESSSGETRNEKGENANDIKNETLNNLSQGNQRPITVTQDIDIERVTGIESIVDDNKYGKSTNDANDVDGAYTNTSDEDPSTPADHMLAINTQTYDTFRIPEGINDETEAIKNVNDNKNEISTQMNTSDEVAEVSNNNNQITIPQDVDIERTVESTNSEPENYEHEEGKSRNDEKNEASKHFDSENVVPLPPANHRGNHTHITITQAVDIGRGDNGDNENEEGENVADVSTRKYQKPITITQDIEVDRTTEGTGREPTVEGNSPNKANERTSEHTDTADASVPLTASHSSNHTDITITQAIDIGGNAKSPVGKSGNIENKEGKRVNDDTHETSEHTGGDTQSSDDQDHITITQDIDIERITESAYSESAFGEDANENSSKDADIHHPANHTHITIKQAIEIGRIAESIIGKSENDKNENGMKANDDKHETSDHNNAVARTPGERKHITITQDVDIERTTESTDDENDAYEETSQQTNTNDVAAHHTANHTHITITQVIDIERITGNTDDASDDHENKKEKTSNDDISGTSENSTPGAQSSAKQKHVIITQVIDIDRVVENDEPTGGEDKEESSSNDETNRTSSNIYTSEAHAHTPANHTHVTVTQEVDIGRTVPGINGEPENVGIKNGITPINGETSTGEDSELTPTDVHIVRTPDCVPEIIIQGSNETGSDVCETIPNTLKTNKDVKCKPCPVNTELRLHNCSSCHCGMLWHLIECNKGFNKYIQRILDNIHKLSKRKDCK